jgi:hypothetical protein
MSRILEFQPTDEQTIVARVLVELHQAIDVSFPNVKPSAKQFSRTVLTNQGESTRVDNKPQVSDERIITPLNEDGTPELSDGGQYISMTPRTDAKNRVKDQLLHTAQLKTIIGESYTSRLIRKLLIILLLLGLGAFAWLVLIGPQLPEY